MYKQHYSFLDYFVPSSVVVVVVGLLTTDTVKYDGTPVQYSYSFFVAVVYATAGGYYYRSSTLCIRVLTNFIDWLLALCLHGMRRRFASRFSGILYLMDRFLHVCMYESVLVGRDRDRRPPPPPRRLN